MNHLHVHIAVDDLDQSIAFYETLFGAAPSVKKDDYAKWILEDPAVNFAISAREGATAGLDHLGIETSDRPRLEAISTRLKQAEHTTLDQEATQCCYAVSDKTWVEDPTGIRWETFYTHGEAAVYGADARWPEEAAPSAPGHSGRCC